MIHLVIGGRRIKAAGRQTVNVTVEEDTTLLDEIVVVGYGVQKLSLIHIWHC